MGRTAMLGETDAAGQEEDQLRVRLTPRLRPQLSRAVEGRTLWMPLLRRVARAHSAL